MEGGPVVGHLHRLEVLLQNALQWSTHPPVHLHSQELCLQGWERKPGKCFTFFSLPDCLPAFLSATLPPSLPSLHCSLPPSPPPSLPPSFPLSLPPFLSPQLPSLLTSALTVLSLCSNMPGMAFSSCLTFTTLAPNSLQAHTHTHTHAHV